MEDITEEAKVTLLDTYFTYHKPKDGDHEKYVSILARSRQLSLKRVKLLCGLTLLSHVTQIKEANTYEMDRVNQ